ncbi:hypothetical protein B296_00058459 [Ensete ventricosum]|uniref:Premnaspirodiene oxygenase n=1 Tax=Ensete ventricosum TaxID=4639 RepID=A0A426XM28_ENSVE|nr:hypothetical protein B296_00058459 [Ensete ventricosum]
MRQREVLLLWISVELLQLPSIPILVLSFLFLLLLIKKRGFTRCGSESHPPRRPPGPWNLPFVGCMHHLVGQLPFRAFRELARKHGPLMLLRLGQVDVVVVSSREAAEEILKNQSVTFAARPELLATKFVFYGPNDIVWSPYGPYWRQLRKLCSVELLSARRIRSFSSIRTEETLDLMRDIAWSGGTPVNLTEKLFGLSNAVVCRAAFGKRREHRERFVPLIKNALVLSGGFGVADMFPSLKFIDILSGANFRLRRLRRQLDETLGDIIKEHEGKASAVSGDKADKVDNLVDVLLRLKDDPQLEVPLTMETVKGVIVDMFMAGTETSSTVVEWAMSELMRNPEIMERAQKEVRELAAQRRNRVEESDISELHYMKLIINETLRLHPPAALLPRLCRETCEVMGYWDDAESFKPERFRGRAMDFKGVDFEYLPFGAGRRICPGIGFGMATVELALAHLLLHFDWELPHGMRPEELDMCETMALIAPRKTELKLIATVRVPLPVAT